MSLLSKGEDIAVYFCYFCRALMIDCNDKSLKRGRVALVRMS
jgi:hypothetical protein